MRNLLIAAMLAMGIATAATAGGAGFNDAPSSSNGVLAEGVIVRLNPDLGDSIHLVIALIETLLPGSEIVILDSFDGRYWLRIPAGAPVDELLNLLNASELVQYASLNYINAYPERENANSFAWGQEGSEPATDQDAWHMLGFEQAQGSASGNGVVVAIIDSGVQRDHPFMQDRIHPASEDLLDDGQAHGEALGHGTHVAGIVALAAPGAQILDLRVLDENGLGHDFYTAKGVWMAVNAGARIINLSLGSKAHKPPILRDVFELAAENDILIVAAAGNLAETDEQYPAAEVCALAIAAVDPEYQLADFSNFGPWITLNAPGVDIYSTLHDDGWGWWSGTSMATPFVAGVAALIAQANPALAAPEIAAYLAGTTTTSASGDAGYGTLYPPAALEKAIDNEALPLFSPLNDCESYFGGPVKSPPPGPVSTGDDASEHYAAGVALSAAVEVLGGLGDDLEVAAVPEMQVSGSTMFAHSESVLELDIASPLGLIELSAGPLGLDALFGGPPGPSATAAEVADLALAVRLLDILGLGDLLKVALTADAVESSALIGGACGDLQPSGNTHIANGTLTASLLGSVGIPLPIGAEPPPNTGIDLDVIGLAGSTLYLNEQFIEGDGVMDSSIRVTALRLVLNVGISIIVPVATVNVELVVGRSRASRNCNTVEVEIALSANPDPGVQGGKLTYTASAANNGPETSRGTRAVFTRPDSTDFVSAEAPGGCVQTRFNQMTCILGDVAPGASADASIAVTPHLPGEVLARVEVDSAEFLADPEFHVRELVTTIREFEAFNSIFSDRFEPGD